MACLQVGAVRGLVGQFGDLKCTEPGHTEAGMVGQIVIK
jgi:uncharacterized cupredoxin-like copper-binding protein